jgi:geranylgeranyl pyrophosphate synthase
VDRVVHVDALRKEVVALPDLGAWPEIERLFPAATEVVRLDWQLPAIGCKVVGGDGGTALPAMAALACLQISIILVDDMLDEEPDGEHRRMGAGRTANLALALQAAAFRLVDRCPVPVERREAAATCLAQMALATAAGQELDVRNLPGEENYWRVVRAKSTPFYGTGLQIGALLGGATATVSQQIYNLGVLFGEAVQIADDLEDAFQTPANPDWIQARNNLVLLYGQTADYLERPQFEALRNQVDDPARLREAQQILIRSGAASYCFFQLIQRHRAARHLLAELQAADPAPIEELLTNQIAPLLQFLQHLHVGIPPDLQGTLA